MTKDRLVAATSTHSGEKVVVPTAETVLKTSQAGAQMLIDPEDLTSGSTHSSEKIQVNGPKKAPTTAALHDDELDSPVSTHTTASEDDGSQADQNYVDQDQDGDADSALPMVEVPAAADVDSEFNFDDEDDEEVDSGMDEFSDLPNIETEASEEAEEDNMEDAIVEEEFEASCDDTESVALLDADSIDDTVEDEDDLQFATIANVVHVIRANRIIASIGAASAKRAEVSDVYTTPQFQDVVVANIEQRGLRKGLVQSGFVLARVKLSASSKATAKAVTAKVEAALAKKTALMAQREKALNQSLAIAAVGINRRFFKDTPNELKANLEAELVQLGVRGGQNLVRAMFAKYGVSYAKSILTLAQKIAAMPEEMRDGYVDALDMTEDGDEPLDEVESEFEGGDDELSEDGFGVEDDEFNSVPPASISAALLHSKPNRRGVASLLSAGVKTTAAMNILNGSQSLV